MPLAWKGESRVITLVVTVSLLGAPEADENRIDFEKRTASLSLSSNFADCQVGLPKIGSDEEQDPI